MIERNRAWLNFNEMAREIDQGIQIAPIMGRKAGFRGPICNSDGDKLFRDFFRDSKAWLLWGRTVHVWLTSLKCCNHSVVG